MITRMTKSDKVIVLSGSYFNGFKIIRKNSFFSIIILIINTKICSIQRIEKLMHKKSDK